MRRKFNIEVEIALDKTQNVYGLGAELQVEDDMRKAIVSSLSTINQKTQGPFLLENIRTKVVTTTPPAPNQPIVREIP